MAVIQYANGQDRTDPIALTDDTTQLEVLAAETATQSGVISETGGSWGIEKIGGGTLTLTADNTYTGPTTISAGTLVLGQLGLVTESDFSVALGATLKFADDMSFADIGSLAGAGDVDLGLDCFLTSYNDIGEDTTFSGSIFDQSGTDPDHYGYFVACGGGLLTLTGDSEFGGFFEVDYDGFVNIDGGSVTSNSTDDSQTIISGTLRILNGGTLNTTWIQNVGGTLIVNGEGSTATASDWTSIKHVLSVENGGVVNSQEDARIGNWVADPATATVSGAGSEWNITGLLEIGIDDADPFFSEAGSLTIAAGGEVTADEITIASVGSLHLGDGGLAGALNAETIANEGAIGANFTDAATLDAIISGTGTLTKHGGGTLILSGDNTFSGGTTIAGGTISLAHDNALGTGALTTTGSVVDYVDGVDIGNALVLEGDDTQLQVLTGAATQSGVISELGGPYGFEKIGDGTLVVSGVNIYTGDTVITAGALQVTNDGAVGTGQVVLNGGAFQAGAADLSFANAFNVNTAGGTIDTNGFDLTISGDIDDGNGANGALTKAGLGTLTLEGSSNYTGPTTIAAGTLLSTTNSALANLSAFTVDEDGTLQIADAVFNHIGSLAGAGAVDIGLASTLRVGLDNATTTFDGDINGAGTFSKTGTGTLTLTGTSDIGGSLTITSNFGTGALAISGGSFDAGGVQHDAGTLSVINGGTLHSDDDLRVRGDLTIDGIGSTVTAAGETEIIAFSNPLEATISDQAILNSEAGATIDSVIGQAVSVTVTGEGSAWNVEDSLTVGGVDFGATLNVTDGGLVTAGDVSLNSLSTLNLGSGGLAGEINTPTIVNAGAIVANFTDTLTLSADISGDGSLTKVGSGTLTLSGNNSYAGGTTLAGGTLRLEDGNALGTGALTTLGSVVDYGEGVVVANPIILSSNDTQLQVLEGIAEQAGDISETGGTRPLEKIGDGILVLSGDNTYTGATTISAGTLIGASDFALSEFSAFTVNAGATLVVDEDVEAFIGSLAGAGTVVVDELAFLSVGSDNTSTAFSGSITGDGDFEKTGSGTMTLTGTSSITGELSLCGCSDSNVLEISGGSFTAGFDTFVFGGTLAITNGGALTTDFLAVDGNVEITGPGSLVTAASGAQIGLGLALAPASLTISEGGILNAGVGAGLFSFSGAATATVTGAGSAWNIAGELFIGDDMGFGAEGDLTIANGGAVTAGHVFVGAGSNLVFGDGGLAGSLIAATIANEGDIIASFADTLTLAAAISGAGQLFKAGIGTLILTGTGSYTGGTTVSGGTLQVDGSIVSAATVGSGGAIGGNGTTAAVTVNAGGTLSPGASAGILSTGNVMLAAGAAFAVEIGGTVAGVTGYDQLDVTGTVELGGATLAASLIGGFDPATGAVFTIIDNDGADAVVGTFAGLAEGTTLAFGGRSFTISYTGGDGNDVALTALAPPPPPPPLGVTIIGNGKKNTVDATHTVKGQPLPTDADDQIFGFGKADKLDGLAGDDYIDGGTGTDRLRGREGADTLLGGKGDDKLFGDAGNDWLSGGLGENRLTGGVGEDIFVFDAKLGSGSKSKSFVEITDLTVGVDLIELDQAIFTALSLGPLPASAFHIGKKAADADDRILYQASKGKLYYDEDGAGGHKAILFAKLDGKPDLSAADFLVV